MLVDRTGAIPDRWTVLGEDDPLPDGPAILPLARLAEATGREGPSGVHLPNMADPHSVAPHFDDLDLISVDFPGFADGRGFSIGRLIRDLGYAGRLRATGPLIADQFAYLLECGFDEVAVSESVAARQPASLWVERLGTVTLAYQRGAVADAPTRASILERRRHAAGG
ncbi:MAG: DUF934 domain-containing protein [Paracoccaceae bacterium]